MEQSVNLPATANQGENFFSLSTFQDAHKVAGVLAKSKLIPQNFQNNVPDCIIAMEMSQRIGASIFSVMQSLYIVHGRPTWSAQFIIASLNSCGRFSPLRFEIEGKGDDRVCYAWAIERGTDERLEGPQVSIQMAVREGWMGKNGSKWQTMPELMLRYRAATFFGRLYAPDILMGMRSDVEVYDEGPGEISQAGTVADDLNARFAGETIDVDTGEVLQSEEPAERQQEPPQEAAKEVTKEEKAPAPKPPPKPQQKAKPETPRVGPEAASLAVKSFLAEINKKATSMEVDQWRAKHHNRVANACGGVESEEFLQVMDYAEVVYRDLLAGEEQARA
jgi:hypothetical protein